MPHFEIRRSNSRVTTPLLVHVPHSSTAVPLPWRSQIILNDAALAHELLAMTDRYTDELVVPAALAQGGVAFVNNLSRLVFDPERFADDSVEEMSKKGMGAVYTRTSDLRPLRAGDFSEAERTAILRELFRPYATALEEQVSAHLKRFGRCLILDAHSFPSHALPYEDETRDRPDLCLGYDEFHAPEPLIAAMERAATEAGWRVGRNTPFAGSYVPLVHYRKNPRVISVMIEMNRSRYMDEATGHRAERFGDARDLAGRLVKTAVLFEAFRNTLFHAATPRGDICIRVGARCVELDALLEGSGHKGWAYVTAFNPNGEAASEAENQRAQARLEHELGTRGFQCYPGVGKADVGDWPPEVSVLILGISEAQALELGRRYGQAAIVLGAFEQPARLLQSVGDARPLR